MLNMIYDLKMIMNGENFTLLGYYAGSSGNFLLTFWDNLMVPSSGSPPPQKKKKIKNEKKGKR